MNVQFSFTQNCPVPQSPDETLHVLTYNLGSLIECHHKSKRYGKGYVELGKKQMADLISMCRYYCEQKGWNFNELMSLGEEAYLERMKDLKKYGICAECGRTQPMHEPSCSQNEKMY